MLHRRKYIITRIINPIFLTFLILLLLLGPFSQPLNAQSTTFYFLFHDPEWGFSDSIEAMRTLAILLQIGGHTEESSTLYQRILELDPDNLISMNNLAWILCEEQGKHQEALELAQRGLKIAPNYFDLIDTRGVIFYRLGEFDKAVSDFNEYIRLFPDITPSSVGTRFHLARAFAGLGQKDKAIQYLQQALELNSQNGGLSTADLTEAQGLLKQLQEGS